jgi:hypothetical protein
VGGYGDGMAITVEDVVINHRCGPAAGGCAAWFFGGVRRPASHSLRFVNGTKTIRGTRCGIACALYPSIRIVTFQMLLHEG